MVNFNDVFNAYTKETYLDIERNIIDILTSSNCLTFTQIYQLLLKKGLKYNQREVYQSIQLMLTNRGIVVRNDYYSYEPKYKLLDNHYWNSSFSKHYINLNIDDKIDSFLLISDTHLGNPELEDLKILYNVYEYAIKNGVKRCFHLGDLFEGSKEQNAIEINNQLNRFIKYYPNPKNELMTYGIIGNHDETVNKYLQEKCFYEYADLRGLSLFNESFYMFPNNKFNFSSNGITIHFSHRVYVSWLVEDSFFMKDFGIMSLLDLSKIESWLDCKNDILISGHLHSGMIFTNKADENGKEHVYIGVPQTGKFNINNSVAYIIHMNYHDNFISSIDLEVLKSDNSKKISIKEIIPISLNEHKKLVKKL